MFVFRNALVSNPGSQCEHALLSLRSTAMPLDCTHRICHTSSIRSHGTCTSRSRGSKRRTQVALQGVYPKTHAHGRGLLREVHCVTSRVKAPSTQKAQRTASTRLSRKCGSPFPCDHQTQPSCEIRTLGTCMVRQTQAACCCRLQSKFRSATAPLLYSSSHK